MSDTTDCPIEDVMQEALLSLRASSEKTKRGKAVNSFEFIDLEEDNKVDIPIEPINLQYALGSVDFKPGTLMEIIGPEQVGKTTLIYT